LHGYASLLSAGRFIFIKYVVITLAIMIDKAGYT